MDIQHTRTNGGIIDDIALIGPLGNESWASDRLTEDLSGFIAEALGTRQNGGPMRFRMLGPLEVYNDDDELLQLGGTKPRATLGFLLVQANRVVSTSQLVKALWPDEAPPMSARKILHNAVWSLRRMLSTSDRANGSVALLSQAPGYQLQVDSDLVDLYLFHRLTEAGRAELMAGSPAAGATRLRDALSLWRGPALADLVEIGFGWPELAAVQGARLDALEDYVDAELRCGNYLAVLGELETMAEAGTLRERSCGQLMLALYRCGRQGDALNVYRRVRTSLVDEFGLEPGRELQTLQHAILTQDPTLNLTGVATREGSGIEVSHGGPVHRADREIALPGAVLAERKQISVLIVRTELGAEFDDVRWERVDEERERVSVVIRETVESLGGTVAASIGSVSLALFGAHQSRVDDAERAVCAALAIRGCLAAAADPTTAAGSGARQQAVHAAVATGEALVRHQPGNGGIPPSVNGALLAECQALLDAVPAGEIQVCHNTRRATESTYSYRRADPMAGWQVGSARTEHAAGQAGSSADAESDIEMLLRVLDRTRDRSMPQLVTLLGESGVDKARLLMEFEHQAGIPPQSAQFIVGTVLRRNEGNALAVHSEMLSAYCGIAPGDPTQLARDRLAGVVRRLVPAQQEAQRLLSRLSPLVDRDGGAPGEVSVRDILDGWRQLLRVIAMDRPLVIVLDRLHRADDNVLDFVEGLAELSGSVPMMVIAAARPSLLLRRPRWGGGKRLVTTTTFEAPPDAAIDRLADSVQYIKDSQLMSSANQFLGGLLADMEDEADDRRRPVRTLPRLERPADARRQSRTNTMLAASVI